jgi:hypothetical protein
MLVEDADLEVKIRIFDITHFISKFLNCPYVWVVFIPTKVGELSQKLQKIVIFFPTF